MRLVAIAALCGVSIILFLPTLPAVWVLWLLLIFSSSLLLLKRVPNLFIKSIYLFAIASIFFCYACLIAQHRLAWQLPKNIENKSVLAQGTIVSVPNHERFDTAFVFALNELDGQKLTDKKVQLNWYDTAPALHVGDRWQLLVKLKRGQGFADPGAFDYAAFMLEQNIHANGYVRSSEQNHLLATHWYVHPIDRIREKLAAAIAHALNNSPYAAMITALVIGDKSGITAPQWQVLQRTGTNHLMVIAGLHIGMLSGVIFLLVNFGWRASRRLILCLPAQQAAGFAALITAIIYSALAGFSIPTERATIMLAVFMLALALKRNLPLGLGLSLALLLVLLLHPLAGLSSGFWLSFAAVTMIFLGMSARIAMRGWWWHWGRLQWVVSVGLIPFTLLLFQNASFISPVANAIVIPIVGFLVVPLSLLASFFTLILPHFAGWLFHCAAWILNIAWHILAWFAALPFVAWQYDVYSGWSLVTLVIGILLLLAPRGFPARYLSILFCLPLVLIQPAAPALNTAKFTLLDVGQGLASVVQTAHHTLIFDTGAKFSANFDLGAAVVIPFLRTQGIRKIDLLIVSHGDNDHIGGAQSILQQLPVTQIKTSVPDRFLPRHADWCLADDHWQWDGVDFRFLYPDVAHLNLDNNSSCVLLVTAGDKKLLLTGDIEKSAEAFLLQQAKSDLAAQIIVAPHHGSKTSSSAGFVAAVDPSWVFYPVGYLNRYHFPNQPVIQRYKSIDAQQARTDQTGAISILLGQNIALKPDFYRLQEPRFWRQVTDFMVH